MKRKGLTMQEKYSNIIVEFLKAHPLIPTQSLEQALGIPDTTISKAVHGDRLIPTKHIFPILCFLAEYGIEIDGYALSYDDQIDSLFGRKFIENVKTIEKDGVFTYIVKESRTIFTDFFDLL